MTDSSKIVKIVSWNIARRAKCWERLIEMGADVALLQEAAGNRRRSSRIVSMWILRRGVRPEGTAIHRDHGVRRSWGSRIASRWSGIEAKSFDDAGSRELAVSRLGTLAAARVTTPGGGSFVCVSMYSPWTRPHVSTDSSWIVSDASAHRIVSDLSALIGRQSGHRIVAAGDLNILRGYGDHGSAYWAERYETVFTRMKALGLPFVGPHRAQRTPG